MISIYFWFFILLCVFAGITALSLILVLIFVIAYWITSLIEKRDNN